MGATRALHRTFVIVNDSAGLICKKSIDFHAAFSGLILSFEREIGRFLQSMSVPWDTSTTSPMHTSCPTFAVLFQSLEEQNSYGSI